MVKTFKSLHLWNQKADDLESWYTAFGAKSYVEAVWVGGAKVPSNGHGHMTKMAVMPIYGNNLKQSSSLEPKADDLETWYAVSGTRVLPNFFK